MRPSAGRWSQCRLRDAVEGLLGLDPGETGAEAEVWAIAKGEMTCSGAGEVEPVRVWIALVVAGRGPQHDERLLSPAHRGSVENEIGQRDTGGDLNGAVVAQQLLDASSGAFGVLCEPV